jgi:hypothetical protein
MYFWNKICGLAAIFFLSVLFSDAQSPLYIKYPGKETLKPVLSLVGSANNKNEVSLLRPFAVIPQNYYTQHFGIMCKKELVIERATKIPFRFRLGSIQQCNYLEGKK